MELVKELILKYAFVSCLLGMTILLLFLGLRNRAIVLKQIFFSLSAVFGALFLYEGYSMLTEPKLKPMLISHKSMEYFQPRDTLGYGVINEGSVNSKKMLVDNSVVYDVVYNFHDGIRVTPNSVDTSDSYAIFLGCSVTFGVGLNDDETLPFLFNEYSDKKYVVRNFAVGGYGTHHILTQVENLIVKDTAITNSHNSVVIYPFLGDHIRRAAGRSVWDYNGPRYEIEGDSLVFKGPFNASHNYVIQKLSWIWKNSHLYRNVFDPGKGRATDYDIRRVLLMFKRMQTLLAENNLEFIVILDDSSYVPEVSSFLDENDIRYYKILDIIPDRLTNSDKYGIPYDGHPTKLYNERLAEFMANQI